MIKRARNRNKINKKRKTKVAYKSSSNKSIMNNFNNSKYKYINSPLSHN